MAEKDVPTQPNTVSLPLESDWSLANTLAKNGLLPNNPATGHTSGPAPLAEALPADPADIKTLKSEQSLTLSAMADTHVRTGQSDAGGDLLHIAAIYRKGGPRDNMLLAGDAELSSTPRSNLAGLPLSARVGRAGAQHQRDTATVTITAGLEKPITPNMDGGAYVTAGLENGPAYDALTGFKDGLHALGGMRSGRHSPPSSGGELIAGVAGRVDGSLANLRHGPISAQLVGTAGLNFSTTNREAMLAGYLWLGSDTGNIFHPALPGMPVPDNRGMGLFAGVRGEAIQYDTETRRQGTDPLRASVEVGAVITLGKTLLSASLTKTLTPVVTHQSVAATPTARAGLTIPF